MTHFSGKSKAKLKWKSLFLILSDYILHFVSVFIIILLSWVLEILLCIESFCCDETNARIDFECRQKDDFLNSLEQLFLQINSWNFQITLDHIFFKMINEKLKEKKT